MFLVLVCLFVMMSPYKNALKPVFAPHRAVFQMHTYCKYSLKMLSDCRDILENVSCLVGLTLKKSRKSVVESLPPAS